MRVIKNNENIKGGMTPSSKKQIKKSRNSHDGMSPRVASRIKKYATLELNTYGSKMRAFESPTSLIGQSPKLSNQNNEFHSNLINQHH